METTPSEVSPVHPAQNAFSANGTDRRRSECRLRSFVLLPDHDHRARAEQTEDFSDLGFTKMDASS